MGQASHQSRRRARPLFALSMRGGVIVALTITFGCARPRHGEQYEPQFTTGPRVQKSMDADPLSGADQAGALYSNVRLDLVTAQEAAAARRTHAEANASANDADQTVEG